MSNTAEALGDLEVYQHVTVTVDDGTTVEGQANPIDYVPEESLRVEVGPDGEEDLRYQFVAEYDGEWSDVRAERIGPDDEDWQEVGTVTDVEAEETEGESGDQVGAGK